MVTLTKHKGPMQLALVELNTFDTKLHALKGPVQSAIKSRLKRVLCILGVNNGESIYTFDWSKLIEDDLDFVEDRLRNTYKLSISTVKGYLTTLKRARAMCQ